MFPENNRHTDAAYRKGNRTGGSGTDHAPSGAPNGYAHPVSAGIDQEEIQHNIHEVDQ